MEFEGRKQLLEKIKEIREADFRNALRLQFPDADFAVSIFHGETTISRFLLLTERILDQLEEGLNGDEWDLLPNSICFPTIDGANNPTVFQRMNELYSAFDQKNWKQCLTRLDWLVQYQKVCGLWERPTPKSAKRDETNFQKRLSSLIDMQSQVQGIVNQLEEEKQTMKELRKTVGEFYALKQREFKSISESQRTASRQADEIGENATKSASHLGELKAKSEEARNLVERLSKQEDEERKKFEELERRNSELQSQLEQKVKEADEAQQKSKLQQAEIESHRDEINKLLGLAADGALGQWFDDRKKLLRKALIRWTIAVPLAAVLAIAWAIIVFLVLRSATDNPYLDLGINIIKTVPAWVLLAFVLRQYRRERFMEEEYAFRAAISKTIKTYTDMLEKSDSEDNKSRNEMLREVLKQIYRMPRLQAEPKPPLMRVRSQDLPAILKEVNRAAGKVPAEEGE